MASQSERKRFYQSASILGMDGGFSVQLDGRTMKTPAGAPLIVPSRALGEAIAGEWNAVEDVIAPGKMPLTRLANSAIDGVANRMAEVEADILNYAATDLVCYRADYPEALVEKQARAWDPILTFIRKRYGADFHASAGIAHMPQPAASLDALKEPLDGLGPFRLAALHVIASITGSALIAIAMAAGGIDATQAWAAAHVDEDWQMSQWGEDFEAAQRRKKRHAEFQDAWRFFDLA